MPPFLPRKRPSTPLEAPRPKPIKRARLADALDVGSTNNAPGLGRTKTYSLGSDSETDSSLSDVDSDQFEDVPVKIKQDKKVQKKNEEAEEDEDEEDEEIEWEDAATDHVTSALTQPAHVPMADGPIQLTFRKDDEVYDYSATVAASGAKKGPTRREKQARIHAHQMHVQFLMFHNAIRNSWIGDKSTQQTLVKQLPSQILKEVKKWKRASGMLPPEPSPKAKHKSKKGQKTNGGSVRSERDWGRPSQRLEANKPDMSRGDPLITLMKVLAAYWKKRFAITAPGLRKRGYGTKHGLKQEIDSYRNEEHDPEKHGELIRNLKEFRKIAEKCEGSRDVGAQLFTALLRGLGIDARMVASLQPVGYGWTKAEHMVPKKVPNQSGDVDMLDLDSSDEETTAQKAKSMKKPPEKRKTKFTRPTGMVSSVIDLDSDTDEKDVSIKDDDSVVDITPSMPTQRKAKYDRDLAYPIYWTEAISPITSVVLPASPLVLETPVASTVDILATFEPRGAKADKARQVMAYVVAHSSDGTAKDVTVRYLRKKLWPGKTRGFRLPVEKVPVLDTNGKVKRYEDYDWFKRVMSPYGRSHNKRTAVDDAEDVSDLVPQEPEKKNDDGGADTLQSLRASADFVLERFLRREEALRPDAEPVRTFTSGKGDKLKEENVYRRADVERCLTAESWHKEGRRPREGEAAMKFVPVRAVTLTRKREAEEHERVTGEKQMQGLYSWDQTEYIIPPPIKDGIIPKNGYGNMDCFVPSMVPEGAVHIPLKGTLRICKKLEIDFAEAVTGFEFGNKRAVPVCTGVVVAKENERLVKDAWQIWHEEQRRKEETKMEHLVLGLWRKFVMGLRIREKVGDLYGEEMGADASGNKHDPIHIDGDDDPKEGELGGGFVNDQEGEELGGGFLMPHEDDLSEAEELVMEHHGPEIVRGKYGQAIQYPTPSSVPSQKVRTTGKKSRSSSTDELSEQSDYEAISSQAEDSEEAVMDFAPKRIRRKPLQSHPPATKTTPNKSVTAKVRRKPLVEDSEGDEPEKARISTAVDYPMESDKDDNDSRAAPHEKSDDSEEAIEYTPRSTRTRQTKPKSKPKLNSKPQARQKKTSRSKDELTSRSKTKTKAKTIPRPKADPDHRKTRGRPQKSGVDANNVKITPKRSSRLLRKESTIVTSPYFQGVDEDEDE